MHEKRALRLDHSIDVTVKVVQKVSSPTKGKGTEDGLSIFGLKENRLELDSGATPGGPSEELTGMWRIAAPPVPGHIFPRVGAPGCTPLVRTEIRTSGERMAVAGVTRESGV